MLGVANREGGYICEQQKDYLSYHASKCAGSTKEKVGKEAGRMETMPVALNSINLIIHSTLDFDQIMQKTISEASKAIECEMVAISF
jgi:hypothetical protein